MLALLPTAVWPHMRLSRPFLLVLPLIPQIR